jgi:hypothetical protein
MGNIEKKTDQDADLKLMLGQYKNSTNLKKIIASTNQQAQDLEDALFELRDLFYINTAEGVQLDVIGKIFKADRGSLNDADYRILIKTKASLIGSGEPEFIISIMTSLYGASYVNYTPSYPAGYYISTDVSITVHELEMFSPAGVGVSFLGFLELTTRDGYLTQEDGGRYKIGVDKQYFSTNFILSNGDNFVLSNGDNFIIYE